MISDNDVNKLPGAVRYAQPIALASKIYQCIEVLTWSLSFEPTRQGISRRPPF